MRRALGQRRPTGSPTAGAPVSRYGSFEPFSKVMPAPRKPSATHRVAVLRGEEVVAALLAGVVRDSRGSGTALAMAAPYRLSIQSSAGVGHLVVDRVGVRREEVGAARRSRARRRTAAAGTCGTARCGCPSRAGCGPSRRGSGRTSRSCGGCSASRPSGFWVGIRTTTALSQHLRGGAVAAAGELVHRAQGRLGAGRLVAVDVRADAQDRRQSRRSMRGRLGGVEQRVAQRPGVRS